MGEQWEEDSNPTTEPQPESPSPVGTAPIPKESESDKYALLKIWLDFLRWFIGSVALVLIVFIFNYHLRERNEGLDEIKEYETHVELVTNVDNIGKRRLLAQFFANVTASENLRRGWQNYYKEVSKEYDEYIASIDNAIAKAPNTPEGQRIIDSLQRKRQLITDQSQLSSIASTSDSSLHGDARPGSLSYVLNAFKNRNTFPSSSDFNKSITLQDLVASDATEGKFSDSMAVEIQGFVGKVILGGRESANLHSTDPDKRTVRLYLSSSASDVDPKHQLIATITPFMIAAAAKRGENYTVEALRQQLLGKKVQIQGWLFYNVMHREEAYAENPDGQRIYRASCWEVTPVTSVKVVE